MGKTAADFLPKRLLARGVDAPQRFSKEFRRGQ